MVKKTIISILALVSFVIANADNKMVIHQKEGNNVDVLLKTNPVITYEGTNLVVATNTATLHYPLNTLEKISFEKTATAIKCLTIISKDAAPTKVYDLNGRLLFTIPANQPIETSLLPSGIYIIKNNKISYKIQK